MIFDVFKHANADRRFFAPEVVQTSAMDCGPAALKCLLEGYGISVSYGRLREACQTDVDGTSIDTLEEVALQLGLEAEQVMVPTDHLLLAESDTLPALVIVRLPNGLTHFVIVWRQYGGFVQVMDPATGRRWQTHQQFLSKLYIHTQPIAAEVWRDWAGSEGFCDPLRERLHNLRVDEAAIERLLETALKDPAWRSLAALDAATRMVDALVRADGLSKGEEAAGVLERFFTRAASSPDGALGIPAPYWSAQPLPPSPDDPNQYVLLRGTVLIRVLGRRDSPSIRWHANNGEEDKEDGGEEPQDGVPPLSPELIAALEETPSQPGRELLRLLQEDGLFAPSVLVVALFLAAFGVSIEVLLFRGLLDIGYSLDLISQRIGAVLALFIFLVTLLLLEYPMTNTVLRIGRQLENRLRIKFLEKIPRLGDRYFHSRLTSDMTQRAHELRQLRTLPSLGVNWLRLTFQLLLTAAGVIWLNPGGVLLAILATLFAVGMSFVTQPLIVEQDLALRTHSGALSRFYLDALLGLIPIRTHGAERAVRHEHESLLVEWIHASMRFYRADMLIQTAEGLIGSGFAIWILFHYIAQGGEASGVLLLFYWTLRLPALGQALAQLAQQYPMQRNRVLRLLEPLGAPEEGEGESRVSIPASVGEESSASIPASVAESSAVAIKMENLSVQAGGHTILSNINLNIEAGEHIAIVGSSGAGKSSLVGIFLGWHRAATGQVLVDGQPLAGQHLVELRRKSAWVDPAVQLWNRSLFENIRYGSKAEQAAPISSVIQQADLFNVLKKLPDGLQTQLGEGGGLLSGGEGQRVRLGRAMYQEDVALVILDEPFRGLDRTKRRSLLARARSFWQDATLIFISHDVGQTQEFERVLVIEGGKIVEDDAPSTLIAQPTSRYRALLEAEQAVRKGMWDNSFWRRLWLEGGKLSEKNDGSTRSGRE